jgi:methylated-DNA-[protein]-cysteine S-methyltransferase
MKDLSTRKSLDIKISYYDSPIGFLEIGGTDKNIVSVNFLEIDPDRDSRLSPLLEKCIHQLDEYFHHKRQKFYLPLLPQGTSFQKLVWEKLQEIPFGTTNSYLDVAKRIGDPKAIRAVAGANGKNPISIIIPCHRVIGANGKLIGYGGGLWRKEWLLRHEQSVMI